MANTNGDMTSLFLADLSSGPRIFLGPRCKVLGGLLFELPTSSANLNQAMDITDLPLAKKSQPAYSKLNFHSHLRRTSSNIAVAQDGSDSQASRDYGPHHD